MTANFLSQGSLAFICLIYSYYTTETLVILIKGRMRKIIISFNIILFASLVLRFSQIFVEMTILKFESTAQKNARSSSDMYSVKNVELQVVRELYTFFLVMNQSTMIGLFYLFCFRLKYIEIEMAIDDKENLPWTLLKRVYRLERWVTWTFRSYIAIIASWLILFTGARIYSFYGDKVI